MKSDKSGLAHALVAWRIKWMSGLYYTREILRLYRVRIFFIVSIPRTTNVYNDILVFPYISRSLGYTLLGILFSLYMGIIPIFGKLLYNFYIWELFLNLVKIINGILLLFPKYRNIYLIRK